LVDWFFQRTAGPTEKIVLVEKDGADVLASIEDKRHQKSLILLGFGRAVGIENNDVRNFKDLRGMRRNTKSLKRNNEVRKGILIAPSKLPRSSSFLDFFRRSFRLTAPKTESAFGPISRHGWQADSLRSDSWNILRLDQIRSVAALAHNPRRQQLHPFLLTTNDSNKSGIRFTLKDNSNELKDVEFLHETMKIH
jgi:hypothetical protein